MQIVLAQLYCLCLKPFHGVSPMMTLQSLLPWNFAKKDFGSDQASLVDWIDYVSVGQALYQEEGLWGLRLS